jgi:NADH-quinone oxidoreductase subunit G
VTAQPVAEPAAGQALLATWRLLLDRGRMQDGEPFLAGTAHPAVARLSAVTAAEAAANGKVTISTERGSLTLPVEITPGLPDRVVWVPTASEGCSVHRDLGVEAGAIVNLTAGGAE